MNKNYQFYKSKLFDVMTKEVKILLCVLLIQQVILSKTLIHTI